MGIFDLFSSPAKESKNLENARLIVNKSRCPQNHRCPSIRVCPTGALKQNGYAAPTVNQAECIKCGKCVRYCPMRALSLQE